MANLAKTQLQWTDLFREFLQYIRYWRQATALAARPNSITFWFAVQIISLLCIAAISRSGYSGKSMPVLRSDERRNGVEEGQAPTQMPQDTQSDALTSAWLGNGRLSVRRSRARWMRFASCACGAPTIGRGNTWNWQHTYGR